MRAFLFLPFLEEGADRDSLKEEALRIEGRDNAAAEAATPAEVFNQFLLDTFFILLILRLSLKCREVDF